MKPCLLCDATGIYEYTTSIGEPGRDKMVKESCKCPYCDGHKYIPDYIESIWDAQEWHLQVKLNNMRQI